MSNNVLLKTLKTQQKQIKAEMATLMEDSFKKGREKMSETDKGVVYIDAQLQGDDKIKYEKLLSEWKIAKNAITIAETKIDEKRVSKTEDQIYGKYFDNIDQKAKVNAQLAKDIIDVGRNKYDKDDITWDETLSSTLCIDAPFIEMGTDGINQVMPFRPVYKEKTGNKRNREVDVFATYRQAEIYASGQFGQYDPLTGMRIEGNPANVAPSSAAPQLTTVTPKAIPDLSMGLYRYLITMNKIIRHCDVRQVSGLNRHWVNRRTQIPEGTIVDPTGTSPYGGEGETLAEKKLTYDAIGIDLWKYGMIIGYTYESEYAVKDWSVPGQILMDGGTAMSNIMGKHVMIGDGTRKPMGIIPSIPAANTFDGKKAATFLAEGAANTWKRPDLVKLMTGQTTQAYFEMGNYYLMMNKNTWGRFISIEDGSGRAAFLAYGSRKNSISPGQIFTGEDVMLDQNIDDIAATKDPIIYANPRGHVVLLADGMRVDFSSEWGYARDVLAYRFIQFAGAAQIDPNMSYKVNVKT